MALEKIVSLMALDKVVYDRAIHGKKVSQQRRTSAFMHDTNVQYANAQAAFMHSSIVRETQRLSLVHRHERTQAGNTCDQI